jgi:hypothetical protein
MSDCTASENFVRQRCHSLRAVSSDNAFCQNRSVATVCHGVLTRSQYNSAMGISNSSNSNAGGWAKLTRQPPQAGVVKQAGPCGSQARA